MKDILGATCSVLCMLHCLALPLLITVGLPVAGLAFLENENIHVLLSVIILAVALWAFPFGWQAHKRLFPSVLAVIGAALLVLSLVALEDFETYLAFFAGLSLVTAHLFNRRLLLRIA
jgi:hypothetical protein